MRSILSALSPPLSGARNGRVLQSVVWGGSTCQGLSGTDLGPSVGTWRQLESRGAQARIAIASAEQWMSSLGSGSNGREIGDAIPKSWSAGASQVISENGFLFRSGAESKAGLWTRDGQRPLVVLYGWLGSTPRQVGKIAKWYGSIGVDTVSYTAPPHSVLKPSLATNAARGLLSLLAIVHKKEPERPLFFHVFSNNGAHMYAHTMRQLADRRSCSLKELEENSSSASARTNDDGRRSLTTGSRRGKDDGADWESVNRAIQGVIFDSCPGRLDLGMINRGFTAALLNLWDKNVAKPLKELGTARGLSLVARGSEEWRTTGSGGNAVGGPEPAVGSGWSSNVHVSPWIGSIMDPAVGGGRYEEEVLPVPRPLPEAQTHHWLVTPLVQPVGKWLLSRKFMRENVMGCVESLLFHQPNSPSLFLYSEVDEVVPRGEVELFLELRRRVGARVEWIRWEDSAHVGHFSAYPDQYAAAVKAFLLSRTGVSFPRATQET